MNIVEKNIKFDIRTQYKRVDFVFVIVCKLLEYFVLENRL